MLRKTTLVACRARRAAGDSGRAHPWNPIERRFRRDGAWAAGRPTTGREHEVRDGSRVRLDTKGPIEVATQRIVATPGATFGWHSHSGPTIVTIFSGTMTFYHAEHCTDGIKYGPGTSFSNLPPEIHLARNNGAVDLVVYATYYVPSSTPADGLRINQLSPGPECPQ